MSIFSFGFQESTISSFVEANFTGSVFSWVHGALSFLHDNALTPTIVAPWSGTLDDLCVVAASASLSSGGLTTYTVRVGEQKTLMSVSVLEQTTPFRGEDLIHTASLNPGDRVSVLLESNGIVSNILNVDISMRFLTKE